MINLSYSGSPMGLMEYLKSKNVCESCNGTGYIEILGDGDNFECDVVGHKKCKCLLD